MEKTFPHKADPFRVPAGYADDLAARIMARVDAMAAAPREATPSAAPVAPKPTAQAELVTPKAATQRSAWRIVTRWLAGAAAVAAFVFVFAHTDSLRPDAAQSVSTQTTGGTEIASSNADLVYDYMMMTDQKVYGYATETDR